MNSIYNNYIMFYILYIIVKIVYYLYNEYY